MKGIRVPGDQNNLEPWRSAASRRKTWWGEQLLKRGTDIETSTLPLHLCGSFYHGPEQGREGWSLVPGVQQIEWPVQKLLSLWLTWCLITCTLISLPCSAGVRTDHAWKTCIFTSDILHYKDLMSCWAKYDSNCFELDECLFLFKNYLLIFYLFV